MTSSREAKAGNEICEFCAAEGGGHRLDCPRIATPFASPFEDDEPKGTCAIHGDFWTDDCVRCGW